MISVRKKQNKTIIIQNFKKVYLYGFGKVIGIYTMLNFMSMLRVDINISYKIFLVWFSIPFLRAFKREKLVTKVFIIINNRKLKVKVYEMRNTKENKIFLLEDIEKINIKKEEGIYTLILKLKDGIKDKTIWTDWYVSDLRLIRKIILEYKAKGEE
ncbi:MULTISPECIES: hypothetical protein [Fusobacterium]|uniref:hypothetical protein n=1 Tax=Fusobacterium TaxID=848 RepID=UPI0003F920FD|nr:MULTISPECIES: hypothetical protein [Fusobacterium]